MESSTRWWPGSLREDDSQEPQIENGKTSEDKLDRTGREHVVNTLVKSGANIFVLVEPEPAGLVSPPPPRQIQGCNESANIPVPLAISIHPRGWTPSTERGNSTAGPLSSKAGRGKTSALSAPAQS
jgi:hypothetical protein